MIDRYVCNNPAHDVGEHFHLEAVDALLLHQSEVNHSRQEKSENTLSPSVAYINGKTDGERAMFELIRRKIEKLPAMQGRQPSGWAETLRDILHEAEITIPEQ